MLWSANQKYYLNPFELESEFEKAVIEVLDSLFGKKRIYLDIKKKIGVKGKTVNIPDAYLIDLSSKKEPKLYVVENELAKHDPLRHIAVQILKFSLSFETSLFTIKNILKESLCDNEKGFDRLQKYANDNNFENIDVLLEKILYSDNSFNALVIIDESSEDLEKALTSKFQFPVEILTLERYRSKNGDIIYRFEPFLKDLIVDEEDNNSEQSATIDPAEIDTVVVPARDEGFQETFIGENRWYKIRIHPSMIPKIKNIAAYRTAPVSAITHIATVIVD